MSSIGDDDDTAVETRAVAKTEMRSTLMKGRRSSTDWAKAKASGAADAGNAASIQSTAAKTDAESKAVLVRDPA